MSEPSPTPQPAAPPPPRTSPITLLRQYLKDLSFESPNAIEVLSAGESPSGAMHVDVRARGIEDGTFEVSLVIRAEAKYTKGTAYLVEIEYASHVAIGEVPREAVEPLLMVEAPRLMFPYARAILTAVTGDGGFAPLMIQPIDFAALYRDYRKRMSQAAPAGAVTGAA
ncbi:MAG: protein-export chaperone SecB [Rhodospirillaceae bacterium]|nr:protein-export chaperone SecB [Rhodospirillaceae bacterium]